MSINDSNVSDSILISQAAAQEAIAMEMHDSDVLSVPSWFFGQESSPLSLTTTEEFDVLEAMRHVEDFSENQ